MPRFAKDPERVYGPYTRGLVEVVNPSAAKTLTIVFGFRAWGLGLRV